MRFSNSLKAITGILLVLIAGLISACARGTGMDAQETQGFSGPTWTPRPFVAGTADATLPSFGWAGGAGGASLAAPADCAGEATSASEITLTWTIPAELSDQLGFRIYQGVESLEEQIADPEALTFVIGNLTANTQYHFDVRSYDSSAESEADACAVDVTTLQ
jgi:hypothetical protein